MNNQIQNICLKHKQPIILKDFEYGNKVYCLVCIQNMKGQDLTQDQLQEYINEQKEGNIKNLQQLSHILEQFIKFKKTIGFQLNAIIELIKNQLKICEQFKLETYEQKLQDKCTQDQFEKLKKICSDQSEFHVEIRNLIEQDLYKFQNRYSEMSKQLFNQINHKQQIKDDIKKYFFQQMKQSSRKEINKCRAFAFNTEGNLLVIACNTQILVNQFKNGLIEKELQRLNNHTDSVYCLHFMKKGNSFVSGSKDKSIIIWEFIKNMNSWQQKTQLKNHQGSVISILMNRKENCLISGSYDKSIKIWREIYQDKWDCQQTIDIKNDACSLSLNEKENKLISCGEEPFIQVMECQNDMKWVIVQTIQVCQNGDQSVFQPKTKDILEVYDFYKDKKYFQKLREIKVQSCLDCDWYFPCQYIKKQKLLTVKHGQVLNIFKDYGYGDYKLQYQCEFTNQCYGRLTDDGQYLITWDIKSQEIQIRKSQYFI